MPQRIASVTWPRLVAFILLALIETQPPVRAADFPRELLLVGRPPMEAELVSAASDGPLRFRGATGEELAVAAEELVRWSTPAAARAVDEMHLADGSRIGLAPTWTSAGALTVDGDGVAAKTSLLGRIQVPRSQLRALFWRLPPDDRRRQELIDRLLKAEIGKSDLLQLANGDRLSGRLVSIQPPGDERDNGREPFVTFDAAIGRVEVPLERVTGLVLAPVDGEATFEPAQKAAPIMWLGLADGSLLAARGLAADETGLVISTLSAGDLRGSGVQAIASLQGQGGRAVYLSDLEPADYRHEPYLDLAWPFARNRNALGAVPIVGERRFLKMVGMHSAARATYKLDGTHDRFAASLAVDDAADGGGSVAFRVYLRKGDFWQTAYASPVVRGGDPPRHVAVDLEGARELALVVDYADRGDERDYANWLDARLERTGPRGQP